MKHAFLWIVALLGVTGCGGRGDGSGQMQPEIPGSNRRATGFEITRAGSATLLTVRDPWQNSRGVTFSYVLAQQGKDVPDTLSMLPRINTPVSRVVALSTTHLAMIETLGRSGTIIGVSGSDLVYSNTLRDRIRGGELVDVGYDEGLNYEAIISLEPDVLFMYGIESSARMVSERLTGLGVPVVFCGEYLEGHPLGKAEWIRFFACFYGLEKEADRFFHRVDSVYGTLCHLASGVQSRPGVITGLPWKDTWFIAGGGSFAARLIADAGGAYLWSGDPSREAVPLDLESVFVRAVEAEVWINPGTAGSIMDLKATDERFGHLPVVTSGKVYNNNARVRPTGANDYWESATVHPEWVLADLIEIFHPGLQADHHLKYYRKLK